jgi:hypothetical protein
MTTIATQTSTPLCFESALPKEELILKTIYDVVKSTNTAESTLQTLCIKALPCQLKEIVDKIIDLERFPDILNNIRPAYSNVNH